MMHGREKSDSAIVAGKPTNKAVLTAAEPVERRAGAEGNANRQSTDRAQNRTTVSQTLERIRRAARSASRRHLPKVRAVCPNWARTDLGGGREVTRVPTAIMPPSVVGGGSDDILTVAVGAIAAYFRSQKTAFASRTTVASLRWPYIQARRNSHNPACS